MSVGTEIKESRGMNVVERKNEGGYEAVLEYLIILRQNQTNFHDYFCPMHCKIMSYTDIHLYLCEF